MRAQTGGRGGGQLDSSTPIVNGCDRSTPPNRRFSARIPLITSARRIADNFCTSLSYAPAETTCGVRNPPALALFEAFLQHSQGRAFSESTFKENPMKFMDLTDKRYCNCDVLCTVIWAHRSSFHLSQGGLSFTGRFVFHREICLLQGGLSFIGRFVFHREVCLSQGGATNRHLTGDGK
jgi:hypothetical protein